MSKTLRPPVFGSLLIVCAGLVVPVGADQAVQKRAPTWTPEQMLQVRSITHVQVAPDGKRVAYVVREAVLEG